MAQEWTSHTQVRKGWRMVEYHCNISTKTQLKQNKKHSHIGAQAEVRKNGSAPEQSPGKGSLLVEQQIANSSLIQQHNL